MNLLKFLFRSRSTLSGASKHEAVTKGAAAMLCGTLPAAAFVVGGSDENQEKAKDLEALDHKHKGFLYKNNVVPVGGGTGIYLGSDGSVGYLLTASHLGEDIGSVTVTGLTYAVRQQRVIAGADLQVIQIGGEVGDPDLPDLPIVRMAAHGVNVGDDLLLMGRGTRMSSVSSDTATTQTANTSAHYIWGSAGELSWAEDSVVKAPEWLGGDQLASWSACEEYEQTVFFTRFDDEADQQQEGAAVAGDSGGPAFVKDSESGEYLLVGITHGVQTHYGQKEKTTEKGNLTAFVNLADYVEYLPRFTKGYTASSRDGGEMIGLSNRITLIAR